MTISQAERDFYRRSREAQGLPLGIPEGQTLQKVRALMTDYLDRVAREAARRETDCVEHCPNCGTPVYKLRHERTKRVALIEADPNPIGDVLVDLDAGTYRLWRGGSPLEYEEHSGRWHVRHEAARCRAGRR